MSFLDLANLKQIEQFHLISLYFFCDELCVIFLFCRLLFEKIV